jgi:hypothetical protein
VRKRLPTGFRAIRDKWRNNPLGTDWPGVQVSSVRVECTPSGAPVKHGGTANGYKNYGGRCDECKAAHNAEMQTTKANRKAKGAVDKRRTVEAAALAELHRQMREGNTWPPLYVEDDPGNDGLRVDGVVDLPALVDAILEAAK